MLIALPYIFFASIMFFLYLYGNYKDLYHNVSVITAYFLFIIFFGFRGYIFTDVFGYKNFFDIVPDLFTLIKEGKVNYFWWEPGFVCYCAFFKLFTNEYLVFQFFDTAIDLILLYSALKWYNSNTGVNFMILIAMSGLPLLIDTLRNTKSIFIFFISLRYVYNHHFLKFLLYYFIALSFHVSSIVFFPLYFLLCKKYSRCLWLMVLFTGIFFFLFGNQILPLFFLSIAKLISGRLGGMLQGYVFTEGSYSAQRGISLGVIEKFLTFFLAFYFYKTIYKEKMVIIINCFLLYFMLYFVFAGFFEVSHRLSILFSFSYWILWPYFLTGFRIEPIKRLFLMCLLLYSVLKCSLYSQPVQKYDNILTSGSLKYSQQYSARNR
jgi:hypothetical protein